MSIVNRIKKRVKKDGVLITAYLGCTVVAAKVKRLRHGSDKIYCEWIEENEQDIYNIQPMDYNPCISIIVPVYNVKKEQLIACIQSVQQQTYKNWQLCLVDDASTMKEVRETLKIYENSEKIDICYREKNGHISRTTNDGLEMATGEFIGLLDCDDILAPNALYEVVKKLNEEKELDFIYSDEDFLSDDGKRRYNPTFKTEWAPDTLMSVMYTNHFSVFRKSIAQEIGGYRVGYEGSQDYDFVLRFTEKTNKIAHISKVLYHWRAREESVASNPESKMYAYQAAIRAKEDAIQRRGLSARVEYMAQLYQSRVVYEPKGNPLVSIIIPSKDNVSCIETCLSSIASKTTYPNYEVIIIDNGSNEENKKQYENICIKYRAQYYHQPMEFNFSRMCNIGASYADGTFYLFLNDDTEVLVDNWLDLMTGHAALDHVGAVGAKLYYPDSKYLQHIGIVNTKQGPCHWRCKQEDIETDYKLQMEFNYCAVTGACLMVEKKKFEEIGKFDETFPVAYNDVSLCFSLYEKGYYNVIRNDVLLYHYESISRGDDMADPKKIKRLLEEGKRLYAKHPSFDGFDPYFSKNMFWMMIIDGIGNLTVRQPSIIKFFDEEKCIQLSDDKISIYTNISKFESLKQIKVEGWFFRKDFKYNNWNQLKLILKSKDKCYSFPLQKMYHEPIEEKNTYVGNSKLCGYLAALDVSDMEEGEYQVYLHVNPIIHGKSYLVETGKKTVIKK